MRVLDFGTAVVAGDIAVKKFFSFFPVVPVVGAAVGIGELTTEFGAIGIAAASAVIGALCRWIYFSLSLSDGLRGVAISPVIAIVLSDVRIPLFQTFLGDISPESLPIVNGFFVGMFGLLIVGFFLDFLRAYTEKKKGG